MSPASWLCRSRTRSPRSMGPRCVRRRARAWGPTSRQCPGAAGVGRRNSPSRGSINQRAGGPGRPSGPPEPGRSSSDQRPAKRSSGVGRPRLAVLDGGRADVIVQPGRSGVQWRPDAIAPDNSPPPGRATTYTLRRHPRNFPACRPGTDETHIEPSQGSDICTDEIQLRRDGHPGRGRRMWRASGRERSCRC
jgi:hypothetical protein